MSYIMDAICNGYDVEIDVWYVNGQYFLGHSSPLYCVDPAFFDAYAHRLWCHAKNPEALHALLWHASTYNLRVFWHNEDDYTITSNGKVWVYPGKTLLPGSICVMPEQASYSIDELKRCYAICTDNIVKYAELLGL